MTTNEGVKDVCRLFFKDDKGQRLEIADYQVLIIKRIFFKYPKKVLCTATTRAGKSLGVAIGYVLLASFGNGEKIRLIAPTQEHTKIVMGYIISHLFDSKVITDRLLHDRKGLGVERLKREMSRQKLTFKDGNEIMSITANITGTGRSLVGWGGTAIGVDEGEQISAEIMRTKVMRMLGDSPDSSIFMIGNPVTHGYMWEKSTDPGWLRMRVNHKDCITAGRMTQEFVDEREAEMTANEFKIWYEAEWPDELQDQLFTQEDLSNMFAPLTKEELKLFKGKPDKKVLGVDVARYGNDLSVMFKALLYGDKWFIVSSKKFAKKSLMATTGQVTDWHKNEKFDRINIDDGGLGGGVTDRLKELPETRSKTNAFIAGENPWKLKRKLTKKEEEDNKQFLNKKAFYYRKFETLARKGLVRVIDKDNAQILHDQLKKMRYEFTSSGALRVIDPEDKSPDFADAANIALFTPPGLVFAFA